MIPIEFSDPPKKPFIRTPAIATEDSKQFIIPNLSGDMSRIRNLTVTNSLNVDDGVLYVDPVNNRVGINTTAPSEILVLSGTGNVKLIAISGSVTTQIFSNGTTGAGYAGTLTNHSFRIRTNNADIAAFTTSGALHIGNVTGISTSAKVQIDSTTQGFLPPRMTTTQKDAISSPAAGLVVYDTSLNKLCVYTGSAWETITSS